MLGGYTSIYFCISYICCLLLLPIAFAGSVMKNYKAMLQQVKDNGVTSEEAFNLAVKLSSEDRYIYFVKLIVHEGINFGWVDMYMYIYNIWMCFCNKMAIPLKVLLTLQVVCVAAYIMFLKKQAFTKILTETEKILKMKNI